MHGGGAATDHLAVRKSRPCARCDAEFVPTARNGGRGHRYCSKGCADGEHREKRRNTGRPRGPHLDATPPVLLELPPAGFFADGLCTQPEYWGRFWWTSDKPQEREWAKAVCKACAVRILCAEWGLAVTSRDSTAIYGGMTGDERRRLRAARRRAASA